MRNMSLSKIIARIISVVLIGVVLASCQQQKESLTETEIQNLRKDYPVNSVEPAFASVAPTNVHELADQAQSVVLAEVVGYIERYEGDEVSSGHAELDEKLSEQGINHEFFGYTLEVIEDYKDYYAKGDIVKMEANVIFEETMPVLKEGMKILVPLGGWGEGEPKDRASFNKQGLYYVTEDNYALASFVDKDEYTGKAVSFVSKDLLEP